MNYFQSRKHTTNEKKFLLRTRKRKEINDQMTCYSFLLEHVTGFKVTYTENQFFIKKMKTEINE